MRGAPFLLFALALSGCAQAVAPVPGTAAGSPPGPPSPAGAPAAKEAIALVFSNSGVRLDSDPSCAGVGTSPGDSSIGDFLAGFLAEQIGDGPGKNWIDASCKDAQAGQAPSGWECQVLVRRVNGEERWGWGVRFLVRSADRKAVPSSFRCIGAG